MSLLVRGSLPAPAFKAYRDRCHAASLVTAGRIVLRELSFYREIEDVTRQDQSEGYAQLRVLDDVETLHIDPSTLRPASRTIQPGHLEYGSSYHNPAYLFCVSGPQVELAHLRCFGQHIVRIENTELFIEDLADSLTDHNLGGRELLFVDCCPVTYNKGEVGSPDGDLRLNYAQKPRFYEPDAEHRVVVGLSGSNLDAPSCLELILTRASLYCSMVA